MARLNVRHVVESIIYDSDSEFSEIKSDDDDCVQNVQGDADKGSDNGGEGTRACPDS